MKKAMILFCLLTICTLGINDVNAQISTQSYLPITNQSGSAAFSATSDGSSGFASHVRAIIGKVESGYGYTYGVHGIAYSQKESTQGRAYGVMGMAGNANISYGVYGHLRGKNRGTAVMGHDGEFSSSASLFSGRWAGYFIGQVKVTKDIFANAFNVTSDKRLKKNITNIENSLEKIMKINGVNYEYKTEEYPEKQLREGTQTGFLAQEIEKVVPDAVSDDQQGFKAVDYTRIIPLLVEGMKAQQIIIDAQNEKIELLEDKLDDLANRSNNDETTVVTEKKNPELKKETLLLQNVPNPFSNQTEIKFQLPESIKRGTLVISNLEGQKIKKFQLEDSFGSVHFESQNLPAGNYVYSIFAYGKLVQSKIMTIK